MTTIVVVPEGDTAVIAADSLTVYSMREVFEFERFWAIGSGRDFALGAMYALYGGKSKAAAAIAEAGVVAGAEFDTGTSLPIYLGRVKLQPGDGPSSRRAK